MLLNRQKALLNYISLSGDIKSKTLLVKALFLLCEEELKPRGCSLYDFFPYKYGPFSFSLMKLDIQKLINEGIISDLPYRIIDKKRTDKVIGSLDDAMSSALEKTHNKYGKMSVAKVKDYVYSRYPYFAIHNDNNPEAYAPHDPANSPLLQEAHIFTIGYEGRSLDAFLNILIANNVKTLVDIRNNPVSMKYGFSGRLLKHYVNETGIKYISIPELGIESQHRKKLDNQEDYINLFKIYESEILPQRNDTMERLKNLIAQEKRIALMCFEKDELMCHRGIASRYLQRYCGNKYGLSHL
jgi:uncharacterized protein (DUF488 family)